MVRQLGDRAPVCPPRRARRGVRRASGGRSSEVRRLRSRRPGAYVTARRSAVRRAASGTPRDGIDGSHADPHLAEPARVRSGISRYTWSMATGSRYSANERRSCSQVGCTSVSQHCSTERERRTRSPICSKTSMIPPRCTTRSRCSRRMVTSWTPAIRRGPVGLAPGWRHQRRWRGRRVGIGARRPRIRCRRRWGRSCCKSSATIGPRRSPRGIVAR